jgi:carboxyl-terminal processing protease
MVHRSRIMNDDRFRAPGAPDPTAPASASDPAASAPDTAPAPDPAASAPNPAPPDPAPSGWATPPPTRGRSALLVAGLVLAVVVTFSLGISVGRGGWSPGPGPEPTPAWSPSADRPDWRLLDQAYDLLDQHYVDPTALDPARLERGAIVGLTESVDDRGHTGYLTADEVKARDESLSGTYVGVGAVLDEEDGRMLVIRVLHDSPAEGAGMVAGDEIVSVDGVGVSGLTTNAVSSKVRGPEGTEVTIELKGTDGATRSVTITRATLDLPIVSWAFAPGTRDAVIRVESFSKGAAKGVAAALQEALGQGAEGAILDLRGNPGGYVNEPVETASHFMKDGVVYLSIDRSGKETPHEVDGKALAPDLPLVVLVNDQTASSAEILTGALQDAGRAVIVGVKTYGTGTVVSTYPLADGGALTIGTERWLTPKGRAIWREGLVPDEVVGLPTGAAMVVPDDIATLPPGGLATTSDAQLKAALVALDREKAAVGGLLDRAA